MLAHLRKLPMLFVLVTGISLLFLAFSYDHQKKVLKDDYGLLFHEKQKALESYIKIGADLGAKNLFDELNAALEDARQTQKIDFYILRYQGHTLWFGEKNGNLDRIDVVYAPNTEVMMLPTFAYRSTMIGDGYELALGIENDFDSYFAEHHERFYQAMLQEGLYTFLIVLAVGLWTLRDIILMVREVRRGKKGRLSSITATSAESDLFKKGLTGYARAVADLEAENRKLGRQVLPSLQKEIHSGRKPPYDFHCTMVRTDINHFSLIFNTHNVTEFMATINEFFDEVSRIVARYGGLIHEFVGDEVIYYFKDSEHPNSFAIALSAVRDVNALAEKFNESTLKARGYPFTVKSSLAHGKVRFGPLVGGFTVAGSVLIETVRILGYINEKDENVVYFDGANRDRIKDIIQTEERMSVKMKGYHSEIALCQYIGHGSLHEVLQSMTPESASQLGLYRNDEDLRTILLDLKEGAFVRPLATTLNAIRTLREPYIARSRIDLAAVLRQWIHDLKNIKDAAQSEDAAKVLSAVVKLYINLVPASDFTAADRDQLRDLTQSRDRRVVANTIEVLTHFSTDSESSRLQAVKSVRDDLRTYANAIVFDGRDEVTNVVLKKLRQLLRSTKAGEVASGLFALGELAAIHRAKDFGYFSAHVDLQSFIEQLPTYAQHTATMVRRQALIAARKAANELVIEQIRSHVKDSGSELLAEELGRYLDRTAGTVNKTSVA